MVDATALQPLADSDTPTLALVGARTPAHSGAEQLAHSGFGSAVESVAPEPAESGAGSVGSFIAPSSTTGSATLVPASGGAPPTLAHSGASSLSPGSAGTLDSWVAVGDGPGRERELRGGHHGDLRGAGASGGDRLRVVVAVGVGARARYSGGAKPRQPIANHLGHGGG